MTADHTAPKSVILFDPYPRSKDLIFRPEQWERLQSLGTIISHERSRMPSEKVERYLPETVAILGQTDMPTERLNRAKKLRAILNVEGNFLPNVDYESCFRSGVHVLAAAPAFAKAVAECALAFAIDLARGITFADRDFRAGCETYGLESNRDTFSLCGAHVGLIGFGNLARYLLPLLVPFHCHIKVYDPWLPVSLIRESHCTPADLDDVLSTSRMIFILATVTTENEGFVGKRELMLIRPGSVVLLMSRAAVVDFSAFLRCVEEGRFRAATDVFPVEPVPPEDPVRRIPGLLLSAHRTGALRESFYRIGEMAVDDLALILSDLPPVRMQPARRETVGRYRNTPGRSYSRETERS
jgi:phosphoglycerate dehydrogenase-like enzyme